MEAFVLFANSEDMPAPEVTEITGKVSRRTSRAPDLRLRFKVLQRDHFTCCSCGRSPATNLGLVLHIDHIKAWSKGGETIIENLQTLCLECNQGKTDA